MRLGYNTNGFAHHELRDCLDVFARIGYESVGLTLDVHHAPPGRTDYARLARDLRDRDLLPVVETGARFLLDPGRKHYPSLLSPDGRARRLEFLETCVDIAAEIGAPCVSLWSGRDEGGDSWAWLIEGLFKVCDRADRAGVDVAFEPEPGMLVDTLALFDELKKRLPHPRLCLTLDIGHVHCLEVEPPAVYLERYEDLVRNVHLDDHRKGVHEHLFFGEGEIDFAPVLQALQPLDVPATVELSRHSHDAVATAEKAYAWLTRS